MQYTIPNSQAQQARLEAQLGTFRIPSLCCIQLRFPEHARCVKLRFFRISFGRCQVVSVSRLLSQSPGELARLSVCLVVSGFFACSPLQLQSKLFGFLVSSGIFCWCPSICLFIGLCEDLLALFQDADEYRMLFQGNVTRSEVILIAANDGMSNLLEASFLNAVWDMHMKILDIKVTAEEAGDALADAAVAVAETGDTLELPSRRLQSAESFNSEKQSQSNQQTTDIPTANPKQQQTLVPRKLAWADPAALVQQHFVEQQLRQQLQPQYQPLPQWTPTGGGTRRRREGLAAAASAQQQQPQQVFSASQLQQPDAVCDPERELPRVRITGLACRPPLAAGEYAFQNLCSKDSTGACEAPDGIIFAYGHKRWDVGKERKTRINLQIKLYLKVATTVDNGKH